MPRIIIRLHDAEQGREITSFRLDLDQVSPHAIVTLLHTIFEYAPPEGAIRRAVAQLGSSYTITLPVRQRQKDVSSKPNQELEEIKRKAEVLQKILPAIRELANTVGIQVNPTAMDGSTYQNALCEINKRVIQMKQERDNIEQTIRLALARAGFIVHTPGEFAKVISELHDEKAKLLQKSEELQKILKFKESEIDNLKRIIEKIRNDLKAKEKECKDLQVVLESKPTNPSESKGDIERLNRL